MPQSVHLIWSLTAVGQDELPDIHDTAIIIFSSPNITYYNFTIYFSSPYFEPTISNC